MTNTMCPGCGNETPHYTSSACIDELRAQLAASSQRVRVETAFKEGSQDANATLRRLNANLCARVSALEKERDHWKQAFETEHLNGLAFLEGSAGWEEDCKTAQKEQLRLRSALEEAQDHICAEYCGSQHHEFCDAAKSALAATARQAFKVGDYIETYYPISQQGIPQPAFEGGYANDDLRREYPEGSGRGVVEEILRGGCIRLKYDGGGTNIVAPHACRLVRAVAQHVSADDEKCLDFFEGKPAATEPPAPLLTMEETRTILRVIMRELRMRENAEAAKPDNRGGE